MQKKIVINGKEVFYPFRSLENYKEMHRGVAEKKGVGPAFKAAMTLTQARKILFK